MKRFNVHRELSRLERKKSLGGSSDKVRTLFVPFFVVCFSFVALTVASYSLEDTGDNVNNIVVNNESVIDEIIYDNVISDNNGESRYFVNNENKYINFNGMLFRVIRINGDGSLRIMLNNDIDRDYYLTIDENLNNWLLNNFGDSKYLVKNFYDNNMYYGDEEVVDLINLYSAKIDFVGLLSYREYKLIYQYDELGSFFLESKDMNGNRLCNNNGIVASCSEFDYYGIRPVISIKFDKLIGEGTIESPFIIEE